jgi:hypothetical protein
MWLFKTVVDQTSVRKRNFLLAVFTMKRSRADRNADRLRRALLTYHSYDEVKQSKAMRELFDNRMRARTSNSAMLFDTAHKEYLSNGNRRGLMLTVYDTAAMALAPQSISKYSLLDGKMKHFLSGTAFKCFSTLVDAYDPQTEFVAGMAYGEIAVARIVGKDDQKKGGCVCDLKSSTPFFKPAKKTTMIDRFSSKSESDRAAAKKIVDDLCSFKFERRCYNPTCRKPEEAGGPPFGRCARCRAVCYCSRACQLSAWKDHKIYCQPKLAEHRPGAGASDASRLDEIACKCIFHVVQLCCWSGCKDSCRIRWFNF